MKQLHSCSACFHCLKWIKLTYKRNATNTHVSSLKPHTCMMDFNWCGAASPCVSVCVCVRAWIVSRWASLAVKVFTQNINSVQYNLSHTQNPQKRYRFSNKNMKVFDIKTLVYYINTDLIITCNFLFEILPCRENI